MATAILAGTGWTGGAALAAFFLPGSLVSRLFPDPASARGEARGNRRDAWQVLANGGAAAVAALLLDPGAALWAVTSSLAAAAADTWATGIGATSTTDPVTILTRHRVPPGTSGGVTAIGTAGGALGAIVVAAAGAGPGGDGPMFIVAALAGFGGMLLDSLLGASPQGRFHCPRCDVPTERRRHRCGAPASPTSGLAWLDNDGVNALTTMAGAGAGWLGWLICTR